MSNNAPAQPAPKPQATDADAAKIRAILDKAFDQVRTKFPGRQIEMTVNIPPLPSQPTTWTRGQTRPLAAKNGN